MGALGSRAPVGANSFTRRKLDLLAATRVGVNQGNVAQNATLVAPLGAAIGGITTVR